MLQLLGGRPSCPVFGQAGHPDILHGIPAHLVPPVAPGHFEHMPEQSKLPADGGGADLLQALVPVGCDVLRPDGIKGGIAEGVAEDDPEEIDLAVAGPLLGRYLPFIPGAEIADGGLPQPFAVDHKARPLDLLLGLPGPYLSRLTALEGLGDGGQAATPDLHLP